MPLNFSVLDLPDLVLDCILERLEPSGLLNMAEVCTSWRSKCRSDHLWQNHMNKKWRKVIGEDALREWQWYVENFESKCCRSRKGKRRGLVVRLASLVWDSVPWIGRVKESKEYETMKTHSPPPDDSIMYWYLALETGKFHFPAQVYNREVKFAIFTVRVKKTNFFATNTQNPYGHNFRYSLPANNPLVSYISMFNECLPACPKNLQGEELSEKVIKNVNNFLYPKLIVL